jgi:putative ribosome biogenesis GTPase RsgA
MLSLACLDGLRIVGAVDNPRLKETFLPTDLFIRSAMQTMFVKLIGARDRKQTVLIGSPGVGKSVLCFLAPFNSL